MLMMLTANLVGFVTGIEGIKYMGEQVFGTFEGTFSTMHSNRMYLGSLHRSSFSAYCMRMSFCRCSSHVRI